jgi:Mn2+/Fe2+ NRAMP family transporter
MLTLTNLCNENSPRQQQHFMQGRRDSVFGRQVALSVLSDNPLACPSLDIVSVPVPVGLDFIGINPVKALYWTAVINGLLAPFLLVAILVVASDKKLMQGQPSSRLGWIVVAITTVAMFAAGVAMFVV